MKNRISLLPWSSFSLEDIPFHIKDYPKVAVGSTCLVYPIHSQELSAFISEQTKFEGQVSRLNLLKEFYPVLQNSIGITRDAKTNVLIVPEPIKNSPSYKQKQQQFMRNLEVQKELSKLYSSGTPIVAPVVSEGSRGDSFYYIITNSSGITFRNIIENECDGSLETKLSVFLYLLDLFERLHEHGYIMLDIKPDNLLFNMNYRAAMIVDADSLIHFEDAVLDNDQLFFTNMRYASPEIKRLPLLLEEGSQHAVRQLLTPYADMYSLSFMLFELLFGRLYDNFSDDLLTEFTEKYYQHPENLLTYQHVQQIGEKLLTILKDTLVQDLMKRTATCYKSVSEYKQDIASLYERLTPCDMDLDLISWYQDGKIFAEKSIKYELFEYHLYKLLSQRSVSTNMKESFLHISEEKLARYQFLKSKHSAAEDSSFHQRHLLKYVFQLKLFGWSTILEHLILKEQKAQNFYEKHQNVFEAGNTFFRQNREHELMLKKIRETL